MHALLSNAQRHFGKPESQDFFMQAIQEHNAYQAVVCKDHSVSKRR